MVVRFFWTTLFLLACGPKHAPESNPEPSKVLVSKYVLYLEAVKGVQDEHGAVDADECDSLQRSGLICAAGGRLDLGSFRDPSKPGRFYRRPVAYPECFASGGSKSTISADQLYGVFWCAWRTRNLEIAEAIWDYGQPRDWLMGDDNVGGLSTRLNPHQVATLASLIHVLGGADHSERLYHPAIWVGCSGFVCALQAYEILLRAELEGKITSSDKAALKYAAERNPNNILSQYAWGLFNGNQDRTVSLLMDDPRYPSDRLPDSSTVCDAWPVQRDDSDLGLKPCSEQERKHSGGDFLFVSSLLLAPRHAVHVLD